MDNDIILALIEEYGVKNVLEGVAVACDRLAMFAFESEGGDTLGEALETDAKTVRRMVRAIVVEHPVDPCAVTPPESGATNGSPLQPQAVREHALRCPRQ